MPIPDYEKLGSFYLGRAVDPANQKDTDHLVLYDSRDLTTHAVCVGMTGSGKTGLCLALLEEAAIDGVPALVIDPKGDLGDLLLAFPKLQAGDFLPWIDEGEAARRNQTPQAYAASTAETWRKGLADWQQDGERIARFVEAVDASIYTPGSTAGRPLAVLRSFAPPDSSLLSDAGAFKDRITATVSGLLGLAGITSDPTNGREHILLSGILDRAWRDNQTLDLAGLIQAVQKPAFDKMGVFDLETFYPTKERMGLAMALNNLLAAPGFSTWLNGEPLDMQSLLFTSQGKPRLSIVSIAHLNDAERMFVVTLLLNEMVSWMRRQAGTSSLRALLYMDEIFGYFPPSALPPSKLPLLTLMKQARAFGVGVILATQNPVDIDYKGLGNAGTWFIGRLQTERDKGRVIEGLLSFGAGGIEKSKLEALLGALTPRVFLMRNVHESEPVLLRTRWALSYLKGPLTLQEIGRLMQAHAGSVAPSAPATSATSAAPAAVGQSKPIVPPNIAEQYLRPAQNAGAVTYSPYVLGTVKAHFIDAASNTDIWQSLTYVAALAEDGSAPAWPEQASTDLQQRLDRAPVAGANFTDLPAALLNASNYLSWAKQLNGFVYEHGALDILRCSTLKLTSKPGTSEGEFRSQLTQTLREQRDAAIDQLRKKYAPRVETLSQRVQRADQTLERERSQLSQQKIQTALSVGTTLLGALLGRKSVSASTLTRAGSAIRGAGRVSSESSEVANAETNRAALQKQLDDLEAELQQEIVRVQGELDAAAIRLDKITLKPRKSDISVQGLALLWVPHE
jgi:hypothetical protein